MILSYLSFTRTEGVLHLKIGRCVSRPSNWRYVFQFRPTYAWDLLTWGFLDGTTRAVGGGLLAGAEDLSRWLPRALSRHRDDWRPMHQLLGRSCVICFLKHHIFRPILLSSRTCIRTTSIEFGISEREWKCLTHDSHHRGDGARMEVAFVPGAAFVGDVRRRRRDATPIPI
jgi:hypothetical protein